MVTRSEAIHTHKQKYGVMYMITFVGAIIPVLTFGGFILNSFSNLATELELTAAITTHSAAGMHPAATLAVAEVDSKLNSILAGQVRERIEKLLVVICHNPDMRASLRDTLLSLESDYRKLTGERWNEPSCAQLGVG